MGCRVGSRKPASMSLTDPSSFSLHCLHCCVREFVCVCGCRSLIMDSTCHNLLVALSAHRPAFSQTFWVRTCHRDGNCHCYEADLLQIIGWCQKGVTLVKCFFFSTHIYPTRVILTVLLMKIDLQYLRFWAQIILIENWSLPRCFEFNKTNFIESKPHYACCILNTLTCVHKVQKLSLQPPHPHSLSHSPTQAHICTGTPTHKNMQYVYFFLNEQP